MLGYADYYGLGPCESANARLSSKFSLLFESGSIRYWNVYFGTLQLATKTKRKPCDICGEKMAVNIEFGNINPFDCTGNPTSVGPGWRRWKRYFEYFFRGQGYHQRCSETSV